MKGRRGWILALVLILAVLSVICVAGISQVWDRLVDQPPQTSAVTEAVQDPPWILGDGTRIYPDKDPRLCWEKDKFTEDPQTEIHTVEDVLSPKVPKSWIIVWPCESPSGFCHHGKGDYLVEEGGVLVVKDDQHRQLIRDPQEIFLVRQIRMDVDPNTRAGEIRASYE